MYHLTPEAIVGQRAHRCEDYDRQYREMEAYADELEKKPGALPD